MRLLLYSGILYLAGVAVILALKPSLMFREDGIWKEFGIGRNSDKYTWFPFWFFVIVWAIVSYCLILILASLGLLPGIDLKPDGSLNNSRNLSKNLYQSATEDEEVFEEYLDNDADAGDGISDIIMDKENAENDLGNQNYDQEDSPYLEELTNNTSKKLQELEVSAPKSNSHSTAKMRKQLPQPKIPNLKKGYYILNTNISRQQTHGVPKYIYLGPEAPKVLYR